jgi:hypothetical protein
VILAAIALGAILVTVRYRPLVEDGLALRQELRSITSRVVDAGPRLDAATLGAIRVDYERVAAREARIADALAGDPLIGIARLLPGIGGQVKAADDLIEAGGLLLSVMRDGLGLAGRFIEVRDATSGASKIQGLVGLAADAHDDLVTSSARVDSALALLDRIPDDTLGPIRAARDEARDQLDRYGPVLGQAVQATEFVPSFLGWDRPKRYLVLAQDPAELRPTGGYTGQYGVVMFDRGRITQKRFHDIATLYQQRGLPYFKGPAPLESHLLGPTQSWRLADANWSPDFPTSARQAEEFYRIEAHGEPIDGVIGLTTYAMDELLRLTGPIEVPGYGVTIEPGNATFQLLAATRGPRVPGGDRKAILGVFADRLLEELYALPSSRWVDMPETFERIRAEHHAALWIKDPSLEAAAARAGWDGSLPAPTTDELVIVEANVGPVSKLHLVTERKIDLDVTLDDAGNSHAQLSLQYDNHIKDKSADSRTQQEARFLLGYQRRDTMGLYLRLLVPLAAQIAEFSLDAGKRPIGGLEANEEELGRRSFGVYAMVPPGRATIRVAWVTPGAVERDADGRWHYRVSLPKPAGRLADPLRVAIHLPPGARLFGAAEPPLQTKQEDGTVAVIYEAPFQTDAVIDLRYEGPPPGG